MLRKVLADKQISFLRSAYYFGDCAPYNCWDGFRADIVDAYLVRMRADGFNSIILLIPGAIPEIEQSNPRMADFFWKSFSTLMRAAQEHGFYVLLRLNYIWDRFPVELDRYELTLRQQLQNPERTRLAGFLCRLYSNCCQYENFLYGFTTWEDSTMYLIDHAPGLSLEERVKIADEIGYCLPSEQRIDEHARIVPTSKAPYFKHYLEFCDEMLVRFYYFVRKSFPKLSMEVRCDTYPYYDSDGTVGAHIHGRQYLIPELDLIGTYYGIYMRNANISEEISAEDAFGAFVAAQEMVLSGRPHDASSALVFVDQFLFSIRERAFSHFAWMEEASQKKFLGMCADWMRRFGIGYAVWSFQDYLSDRILNSRFCLGLAGWHHSGTVEAVWGEGGGCILRKSAAVWQTIPSKLSGAHLLIEVQAIEDSEIEINYALDASLVLRLSRSDKVEQIIRDVSEASNVFAVKVAFGALRVRRLSIGQEVAQHGGYTIDFAATATTKAIVEFNQALGGLDADRSQ